MANARPSDPLTLRVWNGSGQSQYEEYMLDDVFFDDRVGWVLSRAHTMLSAKRPGLKSEDLFLWADRRIDDLYTFATTFVNSLLAGSPLIDTDQFVHAVRVSTGVELAEDEMPTVLGHVDAHAYITGRDDVGVVSTPLLFRRLRNQEYDHIYECNPYRATPQDQIQQVAIIVAGLQDVVWADRIPSGVVNCVIRQDVEMVLNPELTDLYFPGEQLQQAIRIERGIPDTTDRALYRKVLSRIAEDGSVAHASLAYRKLYISVAPIGPPTTVKLGGIFNAFVLDSACPLVKHHNANQVAYRVNTEVVGRLDPSIVTLWTKDIRKRNETLVFKTVLTDGISRFDEQPPFATVFLYPTLHYHAKITVRAGLSTGLQNSIIDSAIYAINGVVGRLGQHVLAALKTSGIVIPMLSRDMLCKQNLKELQMSCTIAVPGDKRPGLPTIRERLMRSGIFQPVYTSREDSKVITLRYKRDSHYRPVFDVNAFIRTNRGLERHELIEAVSITFAVSRQVAASLVQQAEVFRSGDGRFFDGNNVAVWLDKTSGRLAMDVSGTQLDEEMIAHIVDTVAVLSTMTSPKHGAKAVLGTGGDVAAPDVYALLAGEDASLAAAVDQDSDVEYDVPSPELSAEPVDGYLLQRLRDRDPVLFNYEKTRFHKSYPSLCAANAGRQPVVVSEEQLRNNQAQYPNAIDSYLYAGSTPDLKAKNVYICPNVWCPKSEVALTRAQYEAGGCPDPDETPILLFNKDAAGRSKHPGFLSRSKHPSDMCMPCCFYTNHGAKSSGKIRKRMADCGDAVTDGSATGPDFTMKAASQIPCDPGAFGRLPELLAQYIGSSDSVARRCIRHEGQSFLACTISVMNLQMTVRQLAEHIVDVITPHEFLVLGLHRQTRAHVTSEDLVDVYDRFKSWFLSTKLQSYREKWNLEDLAAIVKRSRRLSDLPDSYLSDVHREARLMVQIDQFYQYMLADELPKSHAVLIDVLSSLRPESLNPKGLDVLLLETNDSVGSAHVYCMRSLRRYLDDRKSGDFAIVLVRDGIYEPVVKVDSKTGATDEVFTSHDEKLAAVYEFAGKQCAQENGDENVVLDQIEALYGRVRVFVVGDEPGMAVAVITASSVFIPLEAAVAVPYDAHAVHLRTSLGLLQKKASVAKSLSIIHGLGKRTGHAFYIDARVHPNGMGIVMGDGERYIPTSSSHTHMDFLEARVEDALIDELRFATQWLDEHTAMDVRLRELMGAVLRDNSTLDAVEFLRDSTADNPLSRKEKIDAMCDIVRSKLRVTDPGFKEDVRRLAIELLDRERDLLVAIPAVANSDEVSFVVDIPTLRVATGDRNKPDARTMLLNALEKAASHIREV